MVRRVSALAVAGILLLPAALFNTVAWGGQWRCGYMGSQAIIGDVIGTFGIALGIRIWPFSSASVSLRKSLTKATLMLLMGCMAYILFFAPNCPYATR